MRVTGGLVGAWLFVVLTVGCASTKPGLPADVSDIYFTNAEVGPGKQIYQAGTPQQIQPEAHTFDRARDSKVRLVIVLTRGYAHEIHLTLITPAGRQHPANWSVPSVTSMGTWRTQSWQWPLNASWAPGRYRVDLTMDGVPAGSYTFDVQ
jgi:hypothetical protein